MLDVPTPRDHDEALAAFTTAQVSNVALVVVGGFAAYGTAALMEPLAAQAGPGPEALRFEAAGGRVDRVIRFQSANGGTFSALRDRLTRAMAAQRLAIAPLWEP